MSIRHVFFLILLALPSLPPGAEPDWLQWRAEAVQLLQDLIRLNTTNPPGNERTVAFHLQKLLEADGIETKLLDMVELNGSE